MVPWALGWKPDRGGRELMTKRKWHYVARGPCRQARRRYHWEVRSMAAVAGLSETTVGRMLILFGVRPLGSKILRSRPVHFSLTQSRISLGSTTIPQIIRRALRRRKDTNPGAGALAALSASLSWVYRRCHRRLCST